MKVLFAVHDEKVSSSIVKKYQKEYKEIISYKNVYYFNAILKELQRDKTYDRIVIDEELEEFTSSSYEQKDKFIFDKLDNITDEAANINGNDIPIILICTERRVKSEDILVKIFGIGIYNAIIGNDRSTDEVCRLINKPRSKKEAKIYYRIDAENVNYKHESEDDVSEEEMQHILSYFKKLGKNEERYVKGFESIVSQYNEKQLRIIISILPVHVKSILEEKSPEYQKIVLTSGKTYTTRQNSKSEEPGTSEKLLTDNKNNQGKPIVVPSKMDKTLVKKISIKRPTTITKKVEEEIDNEGEEEIKENIQEDVEVPKKRGRGRPRKVQTEIKDIEDVPVAPKRRGRPPKKPLSEPEEVETVDVLPGIEDNNVEEIEEIEETEGAILPGFEDIENEESEQSDSLYQEEETEEDTQSSTLPGFEEIQEDTQDTYSRQNDYNKYLEKSENQKDYYYDYTEYNNLLSSTKKVIAFVGTSKNGTSFIVNNLADILAKSGIETAILDATKNKNAYYIYTQNDENLRMIAAKSIENLIDDKTEGIPVKNNLTVYTGLPNEESAILNTGPILNNLIKQYSAVLIDCDFNTPMEYFKNVQEIYLVQSMDVLTIQPFTAFLRELKSKNILDEKKIKVIVNKSVKIKGVTAKTIVGGMAYYNDPEMSFMTELFDRNIMIPIEIPFDLEVYQKYLEQIIDCDISVNKYPKEFQTILEELANIVYPLLPGKNSREKTKKKKGYPYSALQDDAYTNNGFSNSVNNTLNNMKKRY